MSRTNRSEGDEPLLLVMFQIPFREGVRIIKYQRSRLETYVMLPAVVSVLVLIHSNGMLAYNQLTSLYVHMSIHLLDLVWKPKTGN